MPLRCFVCLFSTLLGPMVLAQSAAARNEAHTVFFVEAHSQTVEPNSGPGAVNFGKINVCPAGQTSPAPCGRTSKLTYNVTATTTFGATNVVTQGVSNLDFTLSATTCTNTVLAGGSCTVSVTFAPDAPGVRMGAVQLTDSSGNLLVTTYVYGNGQGPVAAFTPGAMRKLPVVGYAGGAMAVDAAGNLYFSTDSGLAKFDPRTGVQTTVAADAPFASGLAVDGAGNIIVSNNGVVEIAPSTGIQTPIGENLTQTIGVAVDGRGNLYIGDDWEFGPEGQETYPRLAEIFAVSGRQEDLLGGSIPGLEGIPLLNFPWGVAVDGAGNAYIATFNFGPVYESIAGTKPDGGDGVIASREFESVGDFNNPSTVAVDAAGDVFVDDCCLDPTGIYEFVPSSGNQTMVVYGPGEISIALDELGNLFYENGPNGALMEAMDSQPATLHFGKIPVGSRSAPHSIVIQNVGNQPLNAVPPGLSFSADFLQVPGSGTPADCTDSLSLAPGATCNLSLVFAPQGVGKIKGKATFSDNALNKTPSATQSVELQGTGIE
jgi:sugar lactone lactonase YvrE